MLKIPHLIRLLPLVAALTTLLRPEVGAKDVVWEGFVESVAPELAPSLRVGQVASGSWEWGEEPGALEAVEATLDAHHVLVLAAQQRLASEVRLRDDPSGGDLIEWRVPVASDALAAGDWRAAWLVVWLWDEAGTMLDSAHPRSVVPAWDGGWWQLYFWHATETRFVQAEGPLHALNAAGEPLTPREEVAEMAHIIRALGGQLAETETALAVQAGETNRLREQLAGTMRTVDFLIQERERLQAELAARAATEDSVEWRELEQRANAAEGLLAVAQDELATVGAERDRLTSELAAARAQAYLLSMQTPAFDAVAPAETTPTAQPSPVIVLAESAFAVETVAPEPVAEEEASLVPASSSARALVPHRRAVAEGLPVVAAPTRPERRTPRGPGKFRR